MLSATRKKKRGKAARRVRVRVRKGGIVEKLVRGLTALVLILVGLRLLGVESPSFRWIDDWGNATGWTIRTVLVSIAITLFALSARQLQQKAI